MKSSCDVLLPTKLGLKNELVTLLNKILLAGDDALVNKSGVPVKDAKSSCSKNGIFC